MSFVAWVIAMVGPVAARMLAAFGVTLITMTGAVVSVTTLKDAVAASIGALPVGMLQMGGLMGLWEACGIWLGTYTFLLTWKTTAGFTAIAKK